MEGSPTSCTDGDASIESWAILKDKINDRNIIFIAKIKNYYIKVIRVMYQRWNMILLQKSNATSILRIIINIIAVLQLTGVIDYFKWKCPFEETTNMEKKTATH